MRFPLHFLVRALFVAAMLLNRSTAFAQGPACDGSRWTLLDPAIPSRSQMACAYDEHRKRLVIFGGYEYIRFGDTWEHDGVNWTKRRTAHTPSARDSASMVYDTVRQKIVLFGGANTSYQSDTWEYD